MKKILTLLLVALAAQLLPLSLFAQPTAREEIAANPFLCGSNHLDYDNYPATAPLTPAPKGYVPFFMNHYGRHGSRWLLNDNEYSRSINILKRAAEQGKLTATGS